VDYYILIVSVYMGCIQIHTDSEPATAPLSMAKTARSISSTIGNLDRGTRLIGREKSRFRDE
jgi:hypothetical protein